MVIDGFYKSTNEAPWNGATQDAKQLTASGIATVVEHPCSCVYQQLALVGGGP